MRVLMLKDVRQFPMHLWQIVYCFIVITILDSKRASDAYSSIQKKHKTSEKT